MPTPTTVNPMTAPPAKATCRAGFMPVFAASMVLTLDTVAIFMPNHPADAERMAPTMKQTIACHPPFSVCPAGGSFCPSRTATMNAAITTTNGAR